MIFKPLFFSILTLLICVTSLANSYSDLVKHAREVPVTRVDSEAIEYIKNETNESIDGLTSHYTLALFENKNSGTSWYILDGYYKLKSGKILFLDYIYRPSDKAWWPIENYKYYIPKSTERLMLEAEELCNPYKRHFIGIISSYFSNISTLSKLAQFFENKNASQPIFIFNDGNTLIVDPTKSSRRVKQVTFTLAEHNLIASLKKELGINSDVLLSGRSPSDENVKKTYVGAANSCQ
ncbi:MAG: hypothetical protein HOO06_08850 [Bdellovibrionaceae bacterium]|jgi:hypothetical protein|nr:hypothetical protein [Pseudobdellovibrionaceae bacterium]